MRDLGRHDHGMGGGGRRAEGAIVRMGLGLFALRAAVRAAGLGKVEITAVALVIGCVAAISINALALQTGRHPNPLAIAPAPVPAVASTPAPGSVAATTRIPMAKVPPRPDATGSLAPRPIARPAALGAGTPLALTPTAGAPVQPAALAEPARRTRAQITVDVQRELARRGFYDGNADGVTGPRTDAAIREAERALGLRESGEPSEQLLSAIRRLQVRNVPRPPAPVAVPPRTVAVQRALANLGYGPLRTDGRTSAETRAAIQRFERDRNMPVTGELSDRFVRELASISGLPID